MLACLELPNLALKDLPIPKHHTELIEKVVQHRSNAADASAGQPADIRASGLPTPSLKKTTFTLTVSVVTVDRATTLAMTCVAYVVSSHSVPHGTKPFYRTG